MKTYKTLKPGQPGTKKWMDKYGKNLHCIRYKVDSENNLKYVTVELIADKKQGGRNNSRISKNRILPLQVLFEETSIRQLIKDAGGRWNREKRVWELAYSEIVALGLEKRIVK
jgi:hypothetical protein